MDYSQKFAAHTTHMSTSAIRELFKALATPGMISLAGGVPAVETFPAEIISKLAAEVISEVGPSIFQYGITEGELPLREAVANHLKARGIETDPENVFISTGAQNAVDATARILLDHGDTVALEAPTFLAAIKSFKTFSPNFVSIPTDEQGVIPDELEKLASENSLKLVYLIPTFQNPSGRTVPQDRRDRIAEIAKKHDLLIIEDDPYFELRYSGDCVQPLQVLAPEHVVYIGSLSKVLSPGLRLGYYIAPEPVAELITSVRQGVDVHANRLGQYIAAKYLGEGHLAKHLPATLELYRKRRDCMLASLEEHFSETNFRWSQPEGGMFVWMEGPDGFDAGAMYKQALEKKVAVVPGKSFFADPEKWNHTFRLNFTNVPEEKIREAIELLAEVCKRG
jgi:2-aminoadipate transaminase